LSDSGNTRLEHAISYLPSYEAAWLEDEQREKEGGRARRSSRREACEQTSMLMFTKNSCTSGRCPYHGADVLHIGRSLLIRDRSNFNEATDRT